MFSRIILVCILCISSVRAAQWCKVFQADHMRFSEIENKQQPFYNNLVAQNYNFSARDQVYYKFALYNGQALYTAPLPLILSSTAPYTMAQLVPNWNLTNPLSQAFPSWGWNQNPPAGMYAATDVQVDKCGRAWIIDRGVKTEADIEPLFNPKILIWSLVENRMLMVYQIPKPQFGPGKSVFTHLEIDTSRRCDPTHAILSDSAQNALVIVKYNQSAQKITSWRVKDASFMPQPIFSNFTSDGKSFINLNLGVYSITIVPSFRKGQTDHLYYSSFTGNTWYKVPLFILYSQQLWTKGFVKISPPQTSGNGLPFFQNVFNQGGNQSVTYIDVGRYFKQLGQVGYVQSARCNYDPVGFGFYCPAPALHAITYWDVRKPFNLDNVLIKDDTLMEYPVQILINKGQDGKQELYVVSDSLIEFLTGVENLRFRYNFYMLGCKLDSLHGKRGSSYQCSADYCKGV